jgi:HSP20 family protein
MLARMLNEFAPLYRLHSDMNRLFEDFFQDLPSQRTFAATYPAMNTWEDGDNAYVEAELPGLSMEDIELYVRGNELTLSGQRKIQDPQAGNWHRRERTEGKFTRMIQLPWEIDADKVEARLADGVLTVKLPKCETCKPKKVKVLSAS